MTEHEAAIAAGWRRLEDHAREAGNIEFAEQAKRLAEQIENPPPEGAPTKGTP